MAKKARPTKGMTEDRALEIVEQFAETMEKEKAAGFLVVVLTEEDITMQADMNGEEMLEILEKLKDEIKEHTFGEGKTKQ